MSKKNSTNYIPEWAKGIVWYQIFPERFCNGDQSNDPRIDDQIGSWPHQTKTAYQTHPWESDWYERQPYEQENGLNIWDTIQRRRYGGDLQGIINKLDYLQDLGVQAIYLNPVFESPSSHKYDAACWHHVDPNFGPDPDGDREKIKGEVFHDPETWVWTSADLLLLELIEKLHKRGMKIILDGVFNHMGLRSPVYESIIKDQRKSPYKNWMKVEKWADETKDGSTIIKKWEGFKELPEIKQDRNGLVKEPAQYVFDITRRWMDPTGTGDTSKGIDGWRLDVAFCIKHPFWKKWRKHVRSINPEAFLVAEVIDSTEVLKPYLKGDEFDAVMNYNFAFAVSEFFIPKKKRIKPKKLDQTLREIRDAFPPDVAHVMHNLLGSHDTDRALSRIMNPHIFDVGFWGDYYERSKGNNPDYITTKPTKEAIETFKLMVMFQMTYVGAPVIYYGDETGMWGANDPCNRKPMIWDDLQYCDEISLPDGEKLKSESVKFNKKLYSFYKKLISIRNKYECLRKGGVRSLIADDKNQIFAFERYFGVERVKTIFNTSGESREVLVQFDSDDAILIKTGEVKMMNDTLEIGPNAGVVIGVPK